ncbi:hypothetical protein FQN49_006697, partial [Arthroderma sp. PD_2]
MSSLRFTEEERQKLMEARRNRKLAREGSSEEVYGTERYWNCAESELIHEDEIDTVTFSAMQRSLDPESPELQEAIEQYRSERERRVERRKSLKDKESRFLKRQAVLDLSKTDNLVSMRAAYVDLLMTIKRKTCRQEQSRFSNAAIAKYGGVRMNGTQRQCFSVITGTWVPRNSLTAAHIFPLSLGQPAMDYIFGNDAKNEINSPRNALLLNSSIEKRFDAHQIVIVPVDATMTEPREWKFVVVDKSIMNHNLDDYPNWTYSLFHHRKLIFPNDFRPRARYLYFHYLVTMIMKLQARKNAGVVRSELPDSQWPELTRVWASHGEYLRDNMIRGFIEEM